MGLFNDHGGEDEVRWSDQCEDPSTAPPLVISQFCSPLMALCLYPATAHNRV